MSESSELDKKVKIYILNSIDDIDSVEDKIDYLQDRFNSEYGWVIGRYGEQKAMTDWLQGLALHIAFYNHEIIELAIEWGSLSANHSENEADKILENYWSFMANKTLQLMRGFRVPTQEECEA